MKRTRGFRCFECDSTAEHAHHVVPVVLGGTRTLPLCESCHRKIHGLSGSGIKTSDLIRAGLARARAAGKRLGKPRTHNGPLIRELFDSGHTYREIARLASCSHGAIADEIKEMRRERSAKEGVCVTC